MYKMSRPKNSGRKIPAEKITESLNRFRGTIRRSSVNHLSLNRATVDLSVLQPFNDSLRPPATTNQLIQVDTAAAVVVEEDQGPFSIKLFLL